MCGTIRSRTRRISGAAYKSKGVSKTTVEQRIIKESDTRAPDKQYMG